MYLIEVYQPKKVNKEVCFIKLASSSCIFYNHTFASINRCMKYIITSFFCIIILSLNYNLKSQTSFTDTISVLTYNLNDYGTASTGNCPTLGSPLRHSYLRTIMQYLQAPDIIGFEKMFGTPNTFSTDTIRLKVLDSICSGCYASAAYTNVSGYKKVNSLFYKTSKLGYLGTTGIYTADKNISDINLHKLYYKSPYLATTKDTIFINVIIVHDNSGSGSSDSAIRVTEIGGAMTWLKNNVKAPGNYIFLGDFNTQSSNEGCFQNMINNADTLIRFFDPPNQLGLWSANPTAFPLYLTQSTRTSDPGDCAATGGINNRFDHILCNKPIMNGTKNVQYIPNSYKVIGQDGLHYNKAINASPTNTSVPANTLNALYLMSEHLPVNLKLIVSKKYPAMAADFLSFNAIRKEDNTELKWQVANHFDVKNYEIQMSIDNVNYNTIDTVTPAFINQVNYSFTDIKLHNTATVFYRIKQTMKDGSVHYSDIVSVNNNYPENKILIAPNPVHNSLSFSLISEKETAACIDIINALGQTVVHQNISFKKGVNNTSINSVSSLSKGLYLIKIVTYGSSFTSKFIKE